MYVMDLTEEKTTVLDDLFGEVKDHFASQEIQLNEEQAGAFDEVTEWLKDSSSKEYRLGGHAGTGKTTVIKTLVRDISMPVAITAFTGKAVAVLRSKQVWGAQTLHSLMYKTHTIDNKMVFEKRSWIAPKLVIVDEGSMISTSLYNDLCSFDVKRLIVGDPAQLEPVGDNPNLMLTCNRTLKQIHRQAENSPIIRLAHEVRNGQELDLGYWESPDKESTVLVTDDPSDMEFQSFNISICAKNSTRHNLNESYRYERGMEEGLQAGDSVMCLQNVKESGLYNGMILKVTSVKEELYKNEQVYRCSLLDPDTEITYYDIPISKEYFGKTYNAAEHRTRKYIYAFDYAYAITAHKSQGSEFTNVGVYREPIRQWDMQRWDYTAMTRASQHLTVFI